MNKLILFLEDGEKHVVPTKRGDIEECVQLQRVIDVAICQWMDGQDPAKPLGLDIDWEILETAQPYICDENNKPVWFIEPNGIIAVGGQNDDG